ncbi:hypothetical protein CSUI_001416 [Cystoisospora suis]|uniref:Uncharacterized protein n=1 Tax=Cystoisospora suis TaxID=483139 RepID=A0A2C6L8N2_9APIC|nr:hypothetical protein CSUI_001416 [Cystoisospora suis]
MGTSSTSKFHEFRVVEERGSCSAASAFTSGSPTGNFDASSPLSLSSPSPSCLFSRTPLLGWHWGRTSSVLPPPTPCEPAGKEDTSNLARSFSWSKGGDKRLDCLLMESTPCEGSDIPNSRMSVLRSDSFPRSSVFPSSSSRHPLGPSGCSLSAIKATEKNPSSRETPWRVSSVSSPCLPFPVSSCNLSPSSSATPAAATSSFRRERALDKVSSSVALSPDCSGSVSVASSFEPPSFSHEEFSRAREGRQAGFATSVDGILSRQHPRETVEWSSPACGSACIWPPSSPSESIGGEEGVSDTCQTVCASSRVLRKQGHSEVANSGGAPEMQEISEGCVVMGKEGRTDHGAAGCLPRSSWQAESGAYRSAVHDPHSEITAWAKPSTSPECVPAREADAREPRASPSASPQSSPPPPPSPPPPAPLASLPELATLFTSTPEECFFFETSPATADLSAATLLPGSAFLERDFLWPVTLTIPCVVSFLFSLFTGDPRLGLLTPQAKFMAWRSLMFLSELHDAKGSTGISAAQNTADSSTLYLGRGGYRAAAARGPFYRGPTGGIPGYFLGQSQECVATSKGKRSVRHALIGDRSSSASSSSTSLQASGAASQHHTTGGGVDRTATSGVCTVGTSPVPSGGGSGGSTSTTPTQLQTHGNVQGKGQVPRSSVGPSSSLGHARFQRGDVNPADSGIVAASSAAAGAGSCLDPSTFAVFKIPTPSLPGVPDSSWGCNDAEAERAALELWEASKRAIGTPSMPLTGAPVSKKARTAAVTPTLSEGSSAGDTSSHGGDSELVPSSASTSAEMHPTVKRDVAAKQSGNSSRSLTIVTDKAEGIAEMPKAEGEGEGDETRREDGDRDAEFGETCETESKSFRRGVEGGNDHTEANTETSKQEKSTPSSCSASSKSSPSSASSDRVSRSVSGDAIDDVTADGVVAESAAGGKEVKGKTGYVGEEEDQQIVGYEENFPRFVCGSIDRRWALQHRSLRIPLDRDTGTRSSRNSPGGSSTRSGLSRASADSNTRWSADGNLGIELQFEEIKYKAAKKMWPVRMPQLPERLTPGMRVQVACSLTRTAERDDRDHRPSAPGSAEGEGGRIVWRDGEVTRVLPNSGEIYVRVQSSHEVFKSVKHSVKDFVPPMVPICRPREHLWRLRPHLAEPRRDIYPGACISMSVSTTTSTKPMSHVDAVVHQVFFSAEEAKPCRQRCAASMSTKTGGGVSDGRQRGETNGSGVGTPPGKSSDGRGRTTMVSSTPSSQQSSSSRSSVTSSCRADDPGPPQFSPRAPRTGKHWRKTPMNTDGGDVPSTGKASPTKGESQAAQRHQRFVLRSASAQSRENNTNRLQDKRGEKGMNGGKGMMKPGIAANEATGSDFISGTGSDSTEGLDEGLEGTVTSRSGGDSRSSLVTAESLVHPLEGLRNLEGRAVVEAHVLVFQNDTLTEEVIRLSGRRIYKLPYDLHAHFDENAKDPSRHVPDHLLLNVGGGQQTDEENVHIPSSPAPCSTPSSEAGTETRGVNCSPSPRGLRECRRPSSADSSTSRGEDRRVGPLRSVCSSPCSTDAVKRLDDFPRATAQSAAFMWVVPRALGHEVAFTAKGRTRTFSSDYYFPSQVPSVHAGSQSSKEGPGGHSQQAPPSSATGNTLDPSRWDTRTKDRAKDWTDYPPFVLCCFRFIPELKYHEQCSQLVRYLQPEFDVSAQARSVWRLKFPTYKQGPQGGLVFPHPSDSAIAGVPMERRGRGEREKRCVSPAVGSGDSRRSSDEISGLKPSSEMTRHERSGGAAEQNNGKGDVRGGAERIKKKGKEQERDVAVLQEPILQTKENQTAAAIGDEGEKPMAGEGGLRSIEDEASSTKREPEGGVRRKHDQELKPTEGRTQEDIDSTTANDDAPRVNAGNNSEGSQEHLAESARESSSGHQRQGCTAGGNDASPCTLPPEDGRETTHGALLCPSTSSGGVVTALTGALVEMRGDLTVTKKRGRVESQEEGHAHHSEDGMSETAGKGPSGKEAVLLECRDEKRTKLGDLRTKLEPRGDGLASEPSVRVSNKVVLKREEYGNVVPQGPKEETYGAVGFSGSSKEISEAVVSDEATRDSTVETCSNTRGRERQNDAGGSGSENSRQPPSDTNFDRRLKLGPEPAVDGEGSCGLRVNEVGGEEASNNQFFSSLPKQWTLKELKERLHRFWQNERARREELMSDYLDCPFTEQETVGELLLRRAAFRCASRTGADGISERGERAGRIEARQLTDINTRMSISTDLDIPGMRLAPLEFTKKRKKEGKAAAGLQRGPAFSVSGAERGGAEPLSPSDSFLAIDPWESKDADQPVCRGSSTLGGEGGDDKTQPGESGALSSKLSLSDVARFLLMQQPSHKRAPFPSNGTSSSSPLYAFPEASQDNRDCTSVSLTSQSNDEKISTGITSQRKATPLSVSESERDKRLTLRPFSTFPSARDSLGTVLSMSDSQPDTGKKRNVSSSVGRCLRDQPAQAKERAASSVVGSYVRPHESSSLPSNRYPGSSGGDPSNGSMEFTSSVIADSTGEVGFSSCFPSGQIESTTSVSRCNTFRKRRSPSWSVFDIAEHCGRRRSGNEGDASAAECPYLVPDEGETSSFSHRGQVMSSDTLSVSPDNRDRGGRKRRAERGEIAGNSVEGQFVLNEKTGGGFRKFPDPLDRSNKESTRVNERDDGESGGMRGYNKKSDVWVKQFESREVEGRKDEDEERQSMPSCRGGQSWNYSSGWRMFGREGGRESPRLMPERSQSSWRKTLDRGEENRAADGARGANNVDLEGHASRTDFLWSPVTDEEPCKERAALITSLSPVESVAACQTQPFDKRGHPVPGSSAASPMEVEITSGWRQLEGEQEAASAPSDSRCVVGERGKGNETGREGVSAKGEALGRLECKRTVEKSTTRRGDFHSLVTLPVFRETGSSHEMQLSGDECPAALSYSEGTSSRMPGFVEKDSELEGGFRDAPLSDPCLLSSASRSGIGRTDQSFSLSSLLSGRDMSQHRLVRPCSNAASGMSKDRETHGSSETASSFLAGSSRNETSAESAADRRERSGTCSSSRQGEKESGTAACAVSSVSSRRTSVTGTDMRPAGGSVRSVEFPVPSGDSSSLKSQIEPDALPYFTRSRRRPKSTGSPSECASEKSVTPAELGENADAQPECDDPGSPPRSERRSSTGAASPVEISSSSSVPGSRGDSSSKTSGGKGTWEDSVENNCVVDTGGGREQQPDTEGVVRASFTRRGLRSGHLGISDGFRSPGVDMHSRLSDFGEPISSRRLPSVQLRGASSQQISESRSQSQQACRKPVLTQRPSSPASRRHVKKKLGGSRDVFSCPADTAAQGMSLWKEDAGENEGALVLNKRPRRAAAEGAARLWAEERRAEGLGASDESNSEQAGDYVRGSATGRRGESDEDFAA